MFVLPFCAFAIQLRLTHDRIEHSFPRQWSNPFSSRGGLLLFERKRNRTMKHYRTEKLSERVTCWDLNWGRNRLYIKTSQSTRAVHGPIVAHISFFHNFLDNYFTAFDHNRMLNPFFILSLNRYRSMDRYSGPLQGKIIVQK